MLATVGVWIHNVAAAILVHRLTGSTLLVGAVSVGQFLPQLALAPWSGARADRHDRRRQALLGVAVSAGGSLGLALWAATGGLDASAGAAPVIVTAIVVGIGFALSGPAMQALVPALVRPSELTTAISMTSLPFTIARTVGPAAGALLITGAGPVATFAVAAAFGGIYLATLARVRPRPVEAADGADRDLLAGWRLARADRGLGLAILAVGVIGIGADPVITLTPALAEAVGAGETFVGTLASAFGAGAALGFVVLGRVRQRLGLEATGTAGLALLAVAMLAAAIAPGTATALAAFTLGGVGMSLSLPTFTALVQRSTPEAVRGRVMALWSIAFLGSRPLTASITGVVADVASVRVALGVTAAAIAVGAWWTRQPEASPAVAPVGPAASAAATSPSVV